MENKNFCSYMNSNEQKLSLSNYVDLKFSKVYNSKIYQVLNCFNRITISFTLNAVRIEK